MTSFDWLLVTLALIALGYLVILAWKKAPQLSIVNPMSSREAQSRERKNSLLEARMMRQVEEHGRSIWKSSLSPVMKAIQEAFRRLAGKLTAIERRYVERQRGGAAGKIDATSLRQMVDEARTAITAGRYDIAEQKLVSVVSHDPKHTEAYEALGRMYLSQGQFAEAKEALEFLAKLSPKDPSVMVALGEVHEALGDPREAYDYYLKGRLASPNNPKYLDFFIQSAIEVGELYEAQQAIDHLREVNPENANIEEFEQMLAEKRTT
jgi:Flp pilus assembly protein TadD